MKLNCTETNESVELTANGMIAGMTAEEFIVKVHHGYTGAFETLEQISDELTVDDSEYYEDIIDMFRRFNEVMEKRDLDSIKNIKKLFEMEYWVVREFLDFFNAGREDEDMEFLLSFGIAAGSKWNYLKLIDLGMPKKMARTYMSHVDAWMDQERLIGRIEIYNSDPLSPAYLKAVGDALTKGYDFDIKEETDV